MEAYGFPLTADFTESDCVGSFLPLNEGAIAEALWGIPEAIKAEALIYLPSEILHFVQKRSSLAEGKSNDNARAFLEK